MELWVPLLVVAIIVGAVGFLLYKIYTFLSSPSDTDSDAYKMEVSELQVHETSHEIHTEKDSSTASVICEGETDENPIGIPAEIRHLASRVKSLENSIETTNLLRKQKEELETDLKKYINGYSFSVMKMGINDLIEAYEFTLEAKALQQKLTGSEPNDIGKYLETISMYLQQGLETSGVEQFTPEIGTSYLQASGCDMTGRTYTSDESEIGLIVAVEKPGWKTVLPSDSTQHEIIRNAQVIVYGPEEE